MEELYDQLIEEICDRQNPNSDYKDAYEYGMKFGFEDGFKAGFELALVAIQNEWPEASGTMIQKIYDQLSQNKSKYL